MEITTAGQIQRAGADRGRNERPIVRLSRTARHEARYGASKLSRR